MYLVTFHLWWNAWPSGTPVEKNHNIQTAIKISWVPLFRIYSEFVPLSVTCCTSNLWSVWLLCYTSFIVSTSLQDVLREQVILVCTLFSGPGCSYPLREGLQERDRSFHVSQKQNPFQACDRTGFRQGVGEELHKSANIVLHLGLHWTLFWGKLDTNWIESTRLSLFWMYITMHSH